MQGRILLFPCPIVEGNISSLSPSLVTQLHKTSHFIVEKAKTARHFIKATGHPQAIAELIIHEIVDNKAENESFLRQYIEHHDIGVISEAGCPGVADPGAELVAWAHSHQIPVIPYVGPSSILMALMSSGFSGQSFVFHGYLPNKRPELTTVLRKLEANALRGQSQIFMEAPYRNAFMIESCTQALSDKTLLCVACDINGPDETIITQSIKSWKAVDASQYHKRPCIYILG
jgi:16S rRNA (cytidine1402-2'-O)-methyltransferase